MENKAVWIQDSGRDAIVAPAAVPEPGEGELLIRVSAHVNTVRLISRVILTHNL